ncbi:hypothetical protein [Streptomyces sp. ISL-100]|uniref:hypothetical protein n=1 Tax=Streptomyces sp. ISL-100 TaxID=2819173 RepID=UPI001BE64AF5|nr:hypothetical protein [Streptomyces sp. ISL-100]MBT2399601.1 hypothetical protein [Streptomyces sp. ISL-100]
MSLPGADELFRTTGGMALQSSSPRRPPSPANPANGEARVPGPAAESDSGAAEGEQQSEGAASSPSAGAGPEHSAAADAEAGGHRSRAVEGDQAAAAAARARRAPESQPPSQPAAQQRPAGPATGAQPRRRGGRGANRRPSGRERHDEKITVYVSAEELMDLEHARLVLRGEHGLAVDRGRIVREAVAVVLADLESRGDASILVRRLRGR